MISDFQTNSAKEPFSSNPAALLGSAQNLTTTGGTNETERTIQDAPGTAGTVTSGDDGTRIGPGGIFQISVPSVGSLSESEFIRKIINSPSFQGWSDAALAGVIANAQAESGFKKLIGGDSVNFYMADGVSERSRNNATTRSVNGWCSWGYWQLNICPDSAGGSDLAKEQNINTATQDGKQRWIEYISVNENQFKYVSKKFLEIEGFTKNMTNAYRAAYLITVKFERPADMESKGVSRGNAAQYKWLQKVRDARLS